MTSVMIESGDDDDEELTMNSPAHVTPDTTERQLPAEVAAVPCVEQPSGHVTQASLPKLVLYELAGQAATCN